MFLTIFFLGVIVYGVLFALLWGWSIIHAFTTPHEDWSRRALWTAAMVANPTTTIWYWYVWKRWAFWLLFTPALAFLALLPIALEGLIRAFTIRDIADRFVSLGTLLLENVLENIPLWWLAPIVVFPFVLRLAALAHLGANSALKAADRNDQAVALALPFFGYGAAMAYCFKWLRIWAAIGLVWFLAATGTFWSYIRVLG